MIVLDNPTILNPNKEYKIKLIYPKNNQNFVNVWFLSFNDRNNNVLSFIECKYIDDEDDKPKLKTWINNKYCCIPHNIQSIFITFCLFNIDDVDDYFDKYDDSMLFNFEFIILEKNIKDSSIP